MTMLRHSFPRALRRSKELAFWRAAAMWRPFSVTSYHLCSALSEYIPAGSTVYDGGANIGQFARAAIEILRPAMLLAIEPSPIAFAELARNIGDESNAEVLRCALGRTQGTSHLNVSANSVSSSLLAIDDRTGLKSAGRFQVHVETLDRIIERYPPPARPVLMKLDLQGYELKALQGANSSLGIVDFLLIELAMRPTYPEEPLVGEVLRFLHANTNLTVIDIVDTLHTADGKVWQADVLLARK